MKNRMALLSAVWLTLLLSACGEATTASNPTSELPVAESVVIDLAEDEEVLEEVDEEIEEEFSVHEQLGLTQGRVTNVVDGDTLDVDIDGTIYRVRLIGINAPERDEYGFAEAKAFVAEQLAANDHIVYLNGSGNDTDPFDRLRRYIWLDLPTDLESVADIQNLLLNQRLMDHGYAVVWGDGPTFRTSADLPTTFSYNFGEPVGSSIVEEVLEVEEVAYLETPATYCGTENRRGYELCVEVIPEAPTSFQNCTLLREWYPRGVPEGHPAYASRHDRDNDGWACE